MTVGDRVKKAPARRNASARPPGGCLGQILELWDLDGQEFARVGSMKMSTVWPIAKLSPADPVQPSEETK